MQKTRIQLLIIFSLLVLGGCASTQMETPQRTFRYSLQAGVNKGGITENTDMELLPGSDIDAFSGATRTGFNVGGRVAYPVKNIALEAGIDFMQNGQTFTWNDPANGFNGTRKFSTNQLSFPTALNIPVFRKSHPQGLIQLKLGHLLQYNMISMRKETGTLPSYSIIKWSNGVIFGLSMMPISLNNGARIGLFIEGYRGSQIYDDHYNQKSFEIPGSSYVKTGIIYHIR